MIGKFGRRSLLFAALAVACLTLSPATSGGPATVTGEVVETYCWVAHQVGGPGHAQCGIECAKHGLPVAIYERKSQKAFILLPPRDKAALPPGLVAAMGRAVSVRGEVIERGGIAFLIVQSWDQSTAK